MCEEIRIYVADLAAYNSGKLHGVWIDATQELEDIQAQVSAMLAARPEGFAEEYAIHDYEGFGGYALSEYQGLQSAHEIACFIEEFGEIATASVKMVGVVEVGKPVIQHHVLMTGGVGCCRCAQWERGAFQTIWRGSNPKAI